MNAVQLLFDTAERLPHKAAMVDEDHSMTYSELRDEIWSLANGLKNQGVHENTHVSLLLGNGPEYVVSYFALLTLGATVVPLNPQYKEKELTYALNDSESYGLIYDHRFEDVVNRAEGDLTSTELLIGFKGRKNHGCEWTKLLNDHSEMKPVDRKKEDTAQIIYTSGTTGKPKGAMITHNNIIWMTKAMTDVQGTNEHDRVMVSLPLFHAYAKMAGLWCSYYQGATVYFVPFHPDTVLERIEREKITIFHGVPTMFTMFIHSAKLKEFDYRSLRIFGSGGASIPLEVVHRIKREMDVEIMEGYGQTEATIMLASQRMDTDKVPGSVGPPVDGIDLRIVDHQGKEVSPGDVGEIIFCGQNAMKGYYNKPQETENTIQNGWVYTGDLGYQDADKNVYIVDRKKDMIIRGGYNVYPREIEEVLYTHPDVIECAVIGEAHEVFGEEIVAYVVVRNDLDEKELAAYCERNLAKYKNPRVYRLLESLPKTVTGKILKGPLKKYQPAKIKKD
ncbi:AMP-binding protein [Halobacillus sp. GSS1]|uniref:class I adenylate-forming enzyme family protein n=1 Tax=Halobacillus sp. GSS1 TaxID=2815919 RepID=UPI001A9011CF|nr:AMP-binding protein [Halobacillus sp. GSS1]MBN9654204.1 AMP-binding protein [Halobacillus sp. GSS1]